MKIKTLEQTLTYLTNPLFEDDLSEARNFATNLFPEVEEEIVALEFSASQCYDDEGNYSFRVLALDAHEFENYPADEEHNKNVVAIGKSGTVYPINLGEVFVNKGSYSTYKGEVVEYAIRHFERFNHFYRDLQDHNEAFARLVGVRPFDSEGDENLRRFTIRLNTTHYEMSQVRDPNNYTLLYKGRDIETNVAYSRSYVISQI